MSTRTRQKLFKGESAFSIFEVMVVIALLAILTAVGVLNYSEFKDSFDRSNSLKQIEFDIRRAKAFAVKEGTRGILAPLNNGSSYSFGYDYLPFTVPAVADNQIFLQNLPGKVTVDFDSPLIFDSRGYLIDDFGALVTQKIELSQNGIQFAALEIFPTGAIEYD